MCLEPTNQHVFFSENLLFRVLIYHICCLKKNKKKQTDLTLPYYIYKAKTTAIAGMYRPRTTMPDKTKSAEPPQHSRCSRWCCSHNSAVSAINKVDIDRCSASFISCSALSRCVLLASFQFRPAALNVPAQVKREWTQQNSSTRVQADEMIAALGCRLTGWDSRPLGWWLWTKERMDPAGAK